METPYRAMAFVKNEVLTTDKMDQLDSNSQWLYENTPRARYFAGTGTATPVDIRTIIVGGKVKINKNNRSDTQKVSVRFGSAFAPGCQVHVTTGIISDFQRKIHCVVNGPGGALYPNSNGFEVAINIAADAAKKDKIEAAFWVAYSAFGYRNVNADEF